MAFTVSLQLRNLPRLTARLRGLKASISRNERLLAELALKKIVLIHRKFDLGGPGWRPRSTAYIAHMAARGIHLDPNRPLVLTGRLKNSFRITDLNDHHVAIVTDVPYAAKHHFGGTTPQGYRLPRRPILFWTVTDRTANVNRVRDAARYALTGNPG